MVSSTPPWLISLIVHFSIMIFLGLLVFEANSVVKRDMVEVDISNLKDNEVYAEMKGDQLTDPSAKVAMDGLEPSKDTVKAISTSDLPMVEHPKVGPPMLDSTPGGFMQSGTVPTSGIALEFSGREDGNFKQMLTKIYGGTALTEDAVKAGLAWLA